MKRNVELTSTELFRLMVAMNVEEIRAKNHDLPSERKAVTELRDKVAREYLAAEGRTA